MKKVLDAIMPEGLVGLCTTILLLTCWFGTATGIFAIVSSNQRGVPVADGLVPMTIVLSVLPALQAMGWLLGAGIALVEWVSKWRKPLA